MPRSLESKIESIILTTGETGLATRRILRLVARELGLASAHLFAWDAPQRKLTLVAEQAARRDAARPWAPALEARLAGLGRKRTRPKPQPIERLLLAPSPRPSPRSAATRRIAYPLLRAGVPVGVLTLARRSGPFDARTLPLLEASAGTWLLLLENHGFVARTDLLSRAANLDGLTGLHNHRFFQDALSRELLRAERTRSAASLLLVDIDHFKDYNDAHGHPKGDIALQAIGAILRRNLRSYDTAARYGGEELALVLPSTSQAQGLAVAERIRTDVARHAFPGSSAHGRTSLTVSIGVATYPVNAGTKTDLIERADKALYLAKSDGRNRSCLSLVVSRKVIRLAFVPPAFTSSYYRDILSGVRDVVAELGNIELTVAAPESESDGAGLSTILGRLLKDKVDAVGICSKSGVFARRLPRFNAAGIPVFLFNFADREDAGEVAACVGYDQQAAGEEIARYVVRILRRRGNVVILLGRDERSSQQRAQGFVAYTRGFPGIRVVAQARADWLRARARRECLKLLQKPDADIHAIVALSDEMALGAVEAVTRAGRLGEVFVVGLDGTQDALASIRAGRLTATLNTNPREMGRILVRSVVRSLVRDETLRKEIHTPINIVDLENVGQYT
jgi:diguanylate cyclase (GGDEF)-like protein